MMQQPLFLPFLPFYAGRAALPSLTALLIRLAIWLANRLPRWLSCTALAVAATSSALRAQGPTRYGEHPDAMQFADELARKRHWDAAWVRRVVGDAQFTAAVQGLVSPSASSSESAMRNNWAVYRRHFVEPMRIRAGVRFWRQHRATLERAEKEYGVPAAVIVGIVGVESVFGRDIGSFRVLDTLATLAFDFPLSHPRVTQRRAFFQEELEAYLQLLRDNAEGKRHDALNAATNGSYAGAMGWPQFMPSSWLRHAVDYDGDGRIDLVNSPADVIGSVAQYFADYGWKPTLPIYYTARIHSSADDLRALLAADIKTTLSAAQMQSLGVSFTDPQALQHGPEQGLLALVMLANREGRAPTYIVGTDNFYALTRYNRSSYYALAVAELGEAIRAQVSPQP